MGRVITAPGVLTNVQGQIDHVTDMYDDIKNNNLKPLTITLDPVSNANGVVSVVTEDPRVTEDMKPISIEVGTPEVFKAPITVTTAAGTVTLACDNAAGTSTVKATFIKTSPVEGGEDYPPVVTSTEFDILADRIGSLETLETTDKSSVVNAVNELTEKIVCESVDSLPFRTGVFYCNTAQTIGGVTIPNHFIYTVNVTGQTATGIAVRATTGVAYSLYGYEGAWVSAVELAPNTSFGGLQMIQISVPVSIPDGRTTAVQVDVDLTPYIPSGKTAYAISNARIGNYILPYFNGNTERTWIELFNTSYKNIRIKNTSSQWGDYGLFLVLFVI